MINRLKPKSEFSRNVLTLMTGTTIAQAIPIAISPILTRIYTPEDFGVFALYMSIASVLSVIATGRYELAIMLPKKDNDAKNLVILSILIAVAVSLISMLLILVFHDNIISLLNNRSISIWLYLVPITVLLTGIFNSLNFWNNRKKQYKLLSYTKVIQTSANSSLKIGMGFFNFGGSGFIISYLISQIVTIFFLNKGFSAIKIKKVKSLALLKKYKKLPFYNLPNALIDSFRFSGITILISKYFTTSMLGQFSLAWTMLQTPMSLIGGSLSQVFFQESSQASKIELYSLTKKFIIKASLVSLPLFVIIYFFSADIFAIFFGAKWKIAGEIASILSPWLYFNFITSPLSTLYITLNKQEYLLMFAIIYAILPIFLILYSHNLGFLIILKYLSALMSFMLILFIILILYFTKKSSKCTY